MTAERQALIAWGGDCMFGRGVVLGMERQPNPLAAIAPRLRGADAAIVNLEGPLTRAPRTSVGPYDLRGDPGAAELLAAAGIDVATVANNHTTDNGAEGLAETLEAVHRAGVLPVGGGDNLRLAGAAGLLKRNGLRVAILAYDATTLGIPAAAAWPGVARYAPVASAAAVRAARARADVVAVSIHWGIESRPVPNDDQRRMASELVAAGADLVVGHHPHVVQPVEWLARPDRRPAVVAWSLGNLLFDALEPETKVGVILETRLDEQGVVALRAVPIETDWRGVRPLEETAVPDVGGVLRLWPETTWELVEGNGSGRWWHPQVAGP